MESGGLEFTSTIIFVNCPVISAMSTACFCVHTTDDMRGSIFAFEGKMREKCIVTELQEKHFACDRVNFLGLWHIAVITVLLKMRACFLMYFMNKINCSSFFTFHFF